MKVLIITSSYDLTVDYFIEKFKTNTQFFRLNMDLFADYKIEVDEKQGWSINYTHWKLDQNQTDAIYYRKPSFPDMSGFEPKYHRIIQKDLITLIQGIVEMYDGRCLSKPSLLSLAENKMYQLSIANKVGFNFPRTLITNSSDSAHAFCTEIKSIVKPLSIGRIYTEGKVGTIQTNLVNEDLKFFGLEICPSYFQEYISKDYEVRVTIINGHAFPVKITSSEKVDWRKLESQNRYTSIQLPDEILTKCMKMLNLLGLKFGAFDFIVNSNKYYFLEVNPNGQWYWLEEALNLDISSSIYNYLVGAK